MINIQQASLDTFQARWTGDKSAGEQFHTHLKNNTAEYWVAKKDNEIIGQAYFFTHLNDPDCANGKHRAYIANLYVLPHGRGQGIATQLMERIFARLVERGFSHATIGVSEAEIKNVQLYERLGFVHKIKQCHADPICTDTNGQPIAMDPFLLISKDLR